MQPENGVSNYRQRYHFKVATLHAKVFNSFFFCHTSIKSKIIDINAKNI